MRAQDSDSGFRYHLWAAFTDGTKYWPLVEIQGEEFDPTEDFDLEEAGVLWLNTAANASASERDGDAVIQFRRVELEASDNATSAIQPSGCPTPGSR